MVFSSSVFLMLFLPIVIILYYNPIIKNRSYRNTLLLLVSLAFYGYGEPCFIALLIFSIFISCDIGEVIEVNPAIFDGSIESLVKEEKPDMVIMMLCEKGIDPVEWNHKSNFDLR